MLQLQNRPLPAATATQLRKYQNHINQQATYAEQVAEGKKKFAQYNTNQSKTFRTVRDTLKLMCPGALRCAYCEDSAYDEVEHIRPKDLYPEQVFVWENYLYACGRCNGPKNNRYAVFSHKSGNFVEVTRKRDQPVVPPEPGDHVFLDPRTENPLDFIELDLRDTFYFTPTGLPTSRNYQRAQFTIEVLQLNDRDELPLARRQAYDSYKARLSEYIHAKVQNKPQTDLNNLVESLKRMNHPTVWQEMKRQHLLHPQLTMLFHQAPEALDW